MFEKYNKLNMNAKKFDSNSEMILKYNIDAYIKPIIELLQSDKYFKNKNILYRPGDVFFKTDIPIITKTRPIEKINILNNVIINLEANRHWYKPLSDVKNTDIPFNKKNNKLIWRGAANGFLYHPTRPSRLTLCKKYTNHPNSMIDIGFINDCEDLKVKNIISIEDQLKSKFLISVEGGDVATNLKWILYSNSTPLMAKPTMASWLMEDKLIEWFHYVPLENDFSDLEEKYNWCLNNIDKCEEIAKNGKLYIEQFLDEEREAKITNLVLRKYVDHVKIKLI